MEVKDMERKLIELRVIEMEIRQQILLHLKEMERLNLWRKIGFKSLPDYCRRELEYGPEHVRDIQIRLGLVLQSQNLSSDDASVQSRIVRIKEWRRQKAATGRMAPYLILSNRTLMQLAQKRPQTTEELLKIPGIGEKKIQTFGAELLGLLQQ